MQHFENEFYRVATKEPRQGPGQDWRAKATVFRKDSGERVDSALITGATLEEAQRALETAISRKLDAMVRPPDWGRDPEPPAIIASYLQLREQLYALHLQESSDPEHAEQARRDAKALEAARLSELKACVNRLLDSQKLALFKPTPEQAATPDNPWHLDDLTAKLELFRLLDAQSPSLQSAEQELRDLLQKA